MASASVKISRHSLRRCPGRWKRLRSRPKAAGSLPERQQQPQIIPEVGVPMEAENSQLLAASKEGDRIEVVDKDRKGRRGLSSLIQIGIGGGGAGY